MASTEIILPDSTTHNDGTGGGTAHTSLQSNDGDTSYIGFGADGYFEGTLEDMPSSTGVDSVAISCSYKYVGGGAYTAQKLRLFVVVGGTSYYGSYQACSSATYATLTETWITNPATSTAWTSAAVNAASAGVEYSSSLLESIRVSYLDATVSYTPTPATVAVTRHLLSVDLWLKRRPEHYGKFVGNMDVLNVPMLGAVDLEHTMGPHSTDVGWEDESWQLRPFAVHGLSIDLNSMSVGARIKDQRQIRCLVRDLAWSDKASGTLLDGIARFATPGAIFTHTRASEHTFTNPVGESEVATTDVPAYGSGGLYMLSASGGRAAPRYYVSNSSATGRTLSAAQGSFQCEVNLAAVSAVANQTVAYCYHDASNWWWLYWDPVTATDRWVFEVRAGGSTYRAIKETTPSPSTWYQIGARWTGANLENGDAAYTLSIFIDRVKGTDAVAGAAMTEAASSNFDFGSKAAAGTDQLNGQIRKIHSYQDVLTDTEMMRAI